MREMPWTRGGYGKHRDNRLVSVRLNQEYKSRGPPYVSLHASDNQVIALPRVELPCSIHFEGVTHRCS